MRIPTKVFFFENGNTAAFDAEGQIPALQKSWFELIIEFLRDNKISEEDLSKIEFKMPTGLTARYLLEYKNWEVFDESDKTRISGMFK